LIFAEYVTISSLSQVEDQSLNEYKSLIVAKEAAIYLVSFFNKAAVGLLLVVVRWLGCVVQPSPKYSTCKLAGSSLSMCISV